MERMARDRQQAARDRLFEPRATAYLRARKVLAEFHELAKTRVTDDVVWEGWKDD